MNIIVEKKLCLSDREDTYSLDGFTLYRNEFNQSHMRTCYGTAVYNCTLRMTYLNYIEIPDRFNFNNVEITVMVLSHRIPNILVIVIATFHSHSSFLYYLFIFV